MLRQGSAFAPATCPQVASRKSQVASRGAPQMTGAFWRSFSKLVEVLGTFPEFAVQARQLMIYAAPRAFECDSRTVCSSSGSMVQK